MDNLTGEHCVFCGATAAVRVSGTSFCAPCGLRQYSSGEAIPTQPRRHRRAALLGLLSSGFLAKMLLGAVAVAAVGGVAATAVRNDAPPTTAATVAAAPETSAAAPAEVAPAVVTATSDDPTTEPTTTEAPGVLQLAAAHRYAAAIQTWADCVAREASEHSGGAFDPHEACPGKPNPHVFGLVAANAPGHDEAGPGNSENAPGHDEAGPGNSENAPGHDEAGPGNSENAPGQDDEGPGESENAPGQDKDKVKDG